MFFSCLAEIRIWFILGELKLFFITAPFCLCFTAAAAGRGLCLKELFFRASSQVSSSMRLLGSASPLLPCGEALDDVSTQKCICQLVATDLLTGEGHATASLALLQHCFMLLTAFPQGFTYFVVIHLVVGQFFIESAMPPWHSLFKFFIVYLLTY